jgi:serine/threonine-protein kinase RsbT
MTVVKGETTPLQTEADIVRVRQVVRQWALQQGFSLVEQTKMVTATSELARNTVIHGGGGTAQLEALTSGNRRGLRVIFVDQGPGIADIAQAMTDGYTTGEGLGLGLGGAKRLVNAFEITSRPGAGTRVCITKWK